MNDASLVNGLSDAQQQALMGRMYELLSRQATRYLAGDSTSLPVETAEELLRSLTYTLRLALREAGKPERALLTDDLAELLRQGQDILQSKLTATHGLWERACLTLPQIRNTYLLDSLKSIKGFFKRYDLWFFAHQIPCAIDYQLCVPVSEELLGLSYIEQWLRKLVIENWILSRFQPQAVCRLLSKAVADYWDHPISMCEQPLINALGLAMLRRPASSPELSGEAFQELESLLLGSVDIETVSERAILFLTEELGAPKDAQSYIKTVLTNALPRIRSARQHGSIRGVFIVS